MQRALVTGASRGIGRALVAELAGRGLEVIATARRADDLAGLPTAARLALDVTSDASVAAAAEAAGRVDVLVNNAGVQERYFSPPYADLDRAQQDAYQNHQARQVDLTAEQAARGIADAIADEGSPLRVPIGQDAAGIIAARARLDDTAWAAQVGGFAQPESKESD